jgi:two-component system nitrate/nitrite sensor histidine kinase NarX
MQRLNLRSRLGLIFLAFSLLVVISVTTTYLGIEAQKKDALVINLAGRQRMLVQQMTRQALEIDRPPGSDSRLALQDSAQAFEQTLLALRDGGEVPYLTGISSVLPATRNQLTRARLDQVADLWAGFRNNLQIVREGDPSSKEFQSAIQSIQNTAPELVAQSDSAVRLFSAEATDKAQRIKWVQIIFLAAALILLAMGVLVTRGSVLEPLRKLGNSAECIGEGNLHTPVQINGPAEIQVLGATMDTMRSQLKASIEETQAWADTLEERVSQRTRELDALYSVSREISSRLDINYVLNSVTEKARQLLDGEIAYLCMLDNRGQTLSLQAICGPDSAIHRSATSATAPLPGHILSGKDAVHCEIKGCHGACEIMASPYQTSHIAAPLQAGNRIIGALCVGSSQAQYFSAESLGLLTKLANAAAVAIENARLYDQAERSAILEERHRFAAEIHDGLAQTLNYLLMSVDLTHDLVQQGKTVLAMEKLERCHTAIDQASRETRQAIASLHDDLPKPSSLQDQLSGLVREIPVRGVTIEWVSEVKPPLMLPHQQSEQILRVAREALLNAQNHSQATLINISLGQQGGQGILTINDNGCGFDPHTALPENGQGHFGMIIMRARAARLEGKLEIDSAPDSGTRISLVWPLHPDDGRHEKHR